MLTTLQCHYLTMMDVQLWQLNSDNSAVNNQTVATNGDLEWEELRRKVENSTACALHEARKKVVFGTGNKHADLMFIGEAPGATEDEQGKPFVGRAGKLLDNMLAAIKLNREDIFITNILKCRPPNNRDPSAEEIKSCTVYLTQQIAFIKPKLIVALGRIAAHHLLSTNLSLEKLRGKIHTYGENKTPLLVTYHPAYLLRSPREKAKAYVDLLKIQEMTTKL